VDRLHSMRIFVKVVEQGNFSRAGKLLNISDTAVTRLIADLETHLGTRLLNRTTRKVSLTETGHAYLERVRSILEEIDDAEATISTLSKSTAGTLRIYSQRQFGQYQLPKLLRRFMNANSKIKLETTLSDRTSDLVEDGFEVGIFLGGLQTFNAAMMARQLGVSEAMLLASPDYIRLHGAPKTPEDLSKHNCLNYPYEQLRHFWPVAGPLGVTNIRISSSMVSNSADMLKQLALDGMGIFILPSFALSDELTTGRLVRILPDHNLGRLPLTLVYPSRRLLPSKVRSFVDFMIEQFPHPEIDPWLKQQPD
jgi:DNA-binding transcriptional LysR family regulator